MFTYLLAFALTLAIVAYIRATRNARQLRTLAYNAPAIDAPSTRIGSTTNDVQRARLAFTGNAPATDARQLRKLADATDAAKWASLQGLTRPLVDNAPAMRSVCRRCKRFSYVAGYGCQAGC